MYNHIIFKNLVKSGLIDFKKINFSETKENTKEKIFGVLDNCNVMIKSFLRKDFKYLFDFEDLYPYSVPYDKEPFGLYAKEMFSNVLKIVKSGYYKEFREFFDREKFRILSVDESTKNFIRIGDAGYFDDNNFKKDIKFEIIFFREVFPIFLENKDKVEKILDFISKGELNLLKKCEIFYEGDILNQISFGHNFHEEYKKIKLFENYIKAGNSIENLNKLPYIVIRYIFDGEEELDNFIKNNGKLTEELIYIFREDFKK